LSSYSVIIAVVVELEKVMFHITVRMILVDFAQQAFCRHTIVYKRVWRERTLSK